MDVSSLKKVISCAKGDIEPDILIVNGSYINVITKEVYKADIAICNGKITNIIDPGLINNGKVVIDATDKFISPGFIESHMHVESTMLSPTEFSKIVLKNGTTSACIDPHEIGNALGVEGVKLFAAEAKKLPFRFFIMIPSCVPSLPGFESGAHNITSEDINKLINETDTFYGLAEMMNYPGVLFQDEEVMKKIIIGQNTRKLIDGHSPGVSGRELDAYLSTGISSDHESTTYDEFIEKLRKGMTVMVRQGSFTKDLKNIFTKIPESLELRNVTIATDDRSVKDLIEKGHLNYSLKLAVESGIDPIVAIQMVTINPATHLGVQHEIGSLTPGKTADVIILNNLKDFKVETTIVGGELIFQKNEFNVNFEKPNYPSWAINSVIINRKISPDDLRAKVDIENGQYKVKVIGVMTHSVITESLVETLEVKDGAIQPDKSKDVLPIVVIERYGKNGNISSGFIKGFNIKHGNFGMATTVGHDSHNMIIVASNYEIMVKLIDDIVNMGGGIVVRINDDHRKLPLKFGGLMSIDDVEITYNNFNELFKFIEPVTEFDEPFMAMSFMALPVIPHLKITDMGLVDVDQFKFTPLVVE